MDGWQEKAAENTFLNILNERSWTTNVDYIRRQLNRPVEEYSAPVSQQHEWLSGCVSCVLGVCAQPHTRFDG
jgi:hypothetical protein